MNLKLDKLKFLGCTLINIIIICFIFYLLKVPNSYALDMKNSNSNEIVEELRIKVPEDFKEVWLQAEKEIWDPWLKNKDGFLGRQIFWNKELSQGLVIIKWENKEKWKKLSTDEVSSVQNNFEKKVKTSLELNYNPFKLVYEGELFEQ